MVLQEASSLKAPTPPRCELLRDGTTHTQTPATIWDAVAHSGAHSGLGNLYSNNVTHIPCSVYLKKKLLQVGADFLCYITQDVSYNCNYTNEPNVLMFLLK